MWQHESKSSTKKASKAIQTFRLFLYRVPSLLNHVPYTTISYLQQAHVYQDLDGAITLPSPKLTQNGNQSVDLTIAFPVKQTVAATCSYLFIQFLSLRFLVPPTNALLDYSNRPWNVAHPMATQWRNQIGRAIFSQWWAWPWGWQTSGGID